ncbi:MAG: low-complexity protein [Gammaproteobacteria bacterium]|jgi:uncharacterized low-complexity protein
MKRNNNLKHLPLLTGAALVMSVSAGVNASPDANLFGMQSLSGGYMQLAEGKCGEGKCGGKSEKEGKCGEGKCGGKSEKEGKCGEGKCGGKG